MTALLSARDLTPDAERYLRIDRDNIYAQILLNCSQEDEAPTKVGALAARLPQFTYQQVVAALRTLTLRKIVRCVGHGRYVSQYGRVPGVDA